MQPSLPFVTPKSPRRSTTFLEDVREFDDFGSTSLEDEFVWTGAEKQRLQIPVFHNEFWTSKQRACHSLHEVSYRACFKPQLPRFFIDRLTRPGDTVYDPFSGRGTTVLEAALLERQPVGCDVNPLSELLVGPRLAPPTTRDVSERLQRLSFQWADSIPEDLLVFYHPETLGELCYLRNYFLDRETSGDLDATDNWIRMVAVSRLTGHSKGFFSVYTLPPNQAVSVKSQRRINERKDQVPPRRNVPSLILRKTKSLLREVSMSDRRKLDNIQPVLVTADARETGGFPAESIDLVVTSPPFLDIVDYEQDNWLRAWFCGVDLDSVEMTIHSDLPSWKGAMQSTLEECHRLLRPFGRVAFEVGEVRNGKVKLEEAVVDAGIKAGLRPVTIVINAQDFTKTANCWGIENGTKGTNTNRIVVFTKA